MRGRAPRIAERLPCSERKGQEILISARERLDKGSQLLQRHFATARRWILILGLVASLIPSTTSSWAAETESAAAAAPPPTSAPVRIYLDASQSGGSRHAGLSIERGIRAALATVGGTLGGREVELIVRDHRASTPRSRKHLREFAEDPNALAIIAGMHSPPLLALKSFINTSGLPVLVPWAAATPITRGEEPQNWIFRLSVDDAKAGFAITHFSVEQEGFRRPYLLLEDTGWGDSNLVTMTQSIKNSRASLAGVGRFGWGMGETTAAELVEDAQQADADVLFLVANTEEGAAFARVVAELDSEKRLPIRSHWGIAGGDFVGRIGKEALEKLDLSLIQTQVSLLSARTPLLERALEIAARQTPSLANAPREMRAAPGFIHAFDLTLLLHQAARGLPWSPDSDANRRWLREALENIEGPVEGLVKTYRSPFTSPATGGADAHEALGLSDLTMGRFNADGLIELDPDRVPAAD
ncbi:MAG: ABC transporter substrate-binding protein [Myxococcota bacterium]